MLQPLQLTDLRESAGERDARLEIATGRIRKTEVSTACHLRRREITYASPA